MASRKNTIDDGFNPELVEGAVRDGIFGMPLIGPPRDATPPQGFTTFSNRHRAPTENEALCFFEHDTVFADVLINPNGYVDEFARFQIVVPPDCSAYRNAPLMAQLVNIYRSRAVGWYYQSRGANVWPLVRWGDERTYTTSILQERVAFSGIAHGSPVVVSGYGCMVGVDNKIHFRAGLDALLDTVEPPVVLVYGPMPESVFGPIMHRAEFLNYPDWTSRMKGGK